MPKVHDCIARSPRIASSGTRPRWRPARAPTTSRRAGRSTERRRYSAYKNEYLPKYGEEDARYIVEECLKHYTRIAFIDHGRRRCRAGTALTLRSSPRRSASGTRRSPVTSDYLRRLVSGPWDGDDFLTIPPGTVIDQAPSSGSTPSACP
ncbi:MAG: DUF1638 domain-containing protein [Candidatus Moduliflexus flocculans]|nr:DUF1638 domain-containing protein [Candidatus Moduliflexus flocculans]